MSKENRHIFYGMQIYTPSKWLTDQAVVVEDNLIHAIIPANMIKHHLPAMRHEFGSDAYLVPGMIDMHVHGACGKDVMDADVEALTVISDALAREGITGFLATTMTADAAQIERVLATVAEFKPSPNGASVLGVHLEGPFISPDKIGAQNVAHVQLPDKACFGNWQKIAKGAIKLVTLAPELPNAIELIQALRSMGVIVSIGHTNANYDETCAAINAGCKRATHLFNAMSGIHQRKPGATGALLMSREVSAELIVDGIHLHPAIVQLAYQVKGKDQLLLVSDAMRAKCLGDGCYDLGGQEVFVKDGRATLADDTLAGSVLTLPQALKNMIAFTGCSLLAAIQMATYNPARMLGITRNKATIEVGKDADLVVLDKELNVVQVMRGGCALCMRAHSDDA